MYEYFPFLWKWFIPYERWKLNKFIDWPLFILVKLFDIIISLFLWILEIIWQLAKIVSLSFRLFWNVTSWWILLGMIFLAMIWFTSFVWNITWVEWDWFPVWLPVLIYLQEILVSLIQALVFPLLIAIFIKVAKVH
jgi:F0F1-type ATP synthase membrane subunit a